jgi:branched-chain amino acid transport system substrate-binding protein
VRFHRPFRRLTIPLVAASLVLASCSSGGGTSSTAPGGSGTPIGPGDKTFLVGAALPLTGALAANGKEQRDGYELWKDAINAKGGIQVGSDHYKVDIKYYDYQSDTTTAVRLTEKLITQDKVQAVLGPYGSGATEAASAITEQYGIPMLSPSGAAKTLFNKGYKYLFATLVGLDTVAKQIMDFSASLDPAPKSIGLIVRNDLFPTAQATAILAEAKARNLDVVYNEQFPPDTTDLSTILLGAKSANPDFLIGLGYVNDLILMTKQARELKLTPKAFLQTAGPSHYSFIPAVKQDGENVLTVDWWAPQLAYSDDEKLLGSAPDYAKAFEDKFSYVPSYISASATACGYLIQRAAELAGSVDPKAMRDALASFDEETFYGHIKFDEGGQNVGTPVVIEQILGGKIVTVFPTDVATEAAHHPFE